MIWKRMALPTLVVSLVWLLVSIATSAYLLWLDGSYERVIRENLQPQESLAQLISDLWRTESLVAWHNGEEPDEKAVGLSVERIQQNVKLIAPWMLTSDEARTFDDMRRLIQDYEQLLQSSDEAQPAVRAARRRLILQEIEQQAMGIREHNQRLMQAAADVRQRTSRVVYVVRVSALIIGPLGGVVLGWLLTRRLDKSMSALRAHLGIAEPTARASLASLVDASDDLDQMAERVGSLIVRLDSAKDELRAAQAEVIRNEQLVAIGGLAAGIAHELRNPMTSVKLLLQYAVQQGGTALNAARIQLILDEIERMEYTIQGLLDFSRPAASRQIPHDLRGPLRRATNLVAGRAGKQRVELRWKEVNEPLPCLGDPQRLQQVFVNLLINGIDAMPNGGVIAVRTAAVSSSSAELWRVDFEDTGPGIPEELLGRLFEPFVSLKERGTGLGLAVSRSIIDSHGGRIEACNLAGGGARFTVWLPQATGMGRDVARDDELDERHSDRSGVDSDSASGSSVSEHPRITAT